MFESCLNRSVLIRVCRSNQPQIERKSMASVGSFQLILIVFCSWVREYFPRRFAICKALVPIVFSRMACCFINLSKRNLGLRWSDSCASLLNWHFRSCDVFDQFATVRECKMDIELLIQFGFHWFDWQSWIQDSTFYFVVESRLKNSMVCHCVLLLLLVWAGGGGVREHRSGRIDVVQLSLYRIMKRDREIPGWSCQ